MYIYIYISLCIYIYITRKGSACQHVVYMFYVHAYDCLRYRSLGASCLFCPAAASDARVSKAVICATTNLIGHDGQRSAITFVTSDETATGSFQACSLSGASLVPKH